MKASKSPASDPVLSSLNAAREAYEAVVRELKVAEAKAEQLAGLVREFHKALYSGNVYELVLRACLTLTGASCGLYVSVKPDGETVSIRAAINAADVSVPSDFITELTCRAAHDGETVISNAPDGQFRNFIAAPVMLLRQFSGIVIVADKDNGDFDENDAQALLSIGDNASVAVENAHLRQRLDQAYLTTITVLADAMEAKDPYTQGHCEEVSRFARRIAKHLHLSEEEQSIVNYAALLHDIGKIGVSDGILNKPGPLLPEEREVVRSHVRVGHDLLRHVPVLEPVAEAVLYHHEWYDGSGYPSGLRGEEIPLAARIVSVVDAYGAMISKRSYKEAYPIERVREELVNCKGSQFDPRIVDTLLTLMDSAEVWKMDDEDVQSPLLPGFLTLRN